jgi:abequosyltransferase
MLTIAIPTYNRNERLNKSMRLLLPQVQENASFCRLIFLDNCSPTPIADTLPAVMNEFPGVQYQIVRNKQNIGANANILRCFELCETEWIWCLSDDDPVLPNALTTIRQHLADHPDCVYFNFPYDKNRKISYLTNGIDDFIDKLDVSANLPWIASAIHRASNIQGNLKYGYQFAFSMLPHVATLLISLGQHGRCYMSATQIMADNDDPTPFENHWSIVTFAMSAPTIYDLPMPFATRQALAQKLFITHHGESINLRTIVIQLLLAYFQGNIHTERFDNKNLLYYYDQIIFRNYYLSQSSTYNRSQIKRYRLIMRFPRVTWRILNFINNDLIKVAKRQDRVDRFMKFFDLPKLNAISRQDRYERI